MKLSPIRHTDAQILATLHSLSIIPAWSEEEFNILLKNPFYRGWIALKESTPLGFILGSFLVPEAEILTLVVLPQYRRHGIGALLLNQFKNYCSQNNFFKIFLEVDQQNLPAHKLYLSNGFTQTGIRKDYYKHKKGKYSDALVMSIEFLSKYYVKSVTK